MTRRILAAALLGTVLSASSLIVTGCAESPVQSELDVMDVASPERLVEQSAARSATKPFWATLTADFNLVALMDPTKPSWVGTLTTDEGEYGIVFYTIGSGKPFDNPFRGTTLFFEETWDVYTWVSFDFDTQTLTHGDLLMSGRNTGVSTQNGKFRANGVVVEAFGDLSMWAGRHVHEMGTIVFDQDGFPQSATGVFRVN